MYDFTTVLDRRGRDSVAANRIPIPGAEPDAVYEAATAYLNALPEEEKDLFDLQRQGVVSAFGYLTDEGGEGLLSDCGYAAAHYPWNEGKVRDCFVALLGSD